MRNLVRCTFAVLIASFALAHGVSAGMEEDEGEESEFVRTGFYLGVGGTAAFPHNWNNDVDDQLNDPATDLANMNAQANSDAMEPPAGVVIPLSITVNDAHLDDTDFGLNGVIGYRAGPLVAFEVEGEWLISSNDTDFGVNSVDMVGPEEFVTLQSSTGSHRAEVDEIWTITANLKAYPPFTGWLRPLARFQPFAKVGLGVQNSRLVTDIETSGLTTTNNAETIVVPADFQIRSTETSLNGVFRVGGGIDIYATRNIVSEINATYVVPFADVGPLKTDYVSVQWRLTFRF